MTDPTAIVVRHEEPGGVIARIKESLRRASDKEQEVDAARWEAADGMLRAESEGWSHPELAAELGVTRQTVTGCIKCARDWPLGGPRPAWKDAWKKVKGKAKSQSRTDHPGWFDPLEEFEVVREFLKTRMGSWPEEYRSTIRNFLTTVAEQLEELYADHGGKGADSTGPGSRQAG